MKLPVELRNRIYGLTLVSNEELLITYQFKKQPCRHVAASPLNAISSMKRMRKSTAQALPRVCFLSTCRSIRRILEFSMDEISRS